MELSGFIVAENAPLPDILKKINANKKQFCLVSDSNGKLVGTITDGDVRRHLMDNPGDMDAKASEICNRSSSSITPSTNLATIISIFRDGKIGFLPVVSEGGVILDILTKRQLHTMLTREMSFQKPVGKKYVDLDDSLLESEIEPKPWGFYKVLLSADDTKVKILAVNPGEETSLQLHKKREEFWIVVKGRGTILLDESERGISPGNYVSVPKECKHRISNPYDAPLILVEVQIGEYFGEDDIVRIQDKYER
jgi:mannose-1-phosphate guanylyltransferase / mannose-6-phosphate isomerase